MRLSCLAAFLCAGTLFGQGFNGLATNLDGSVLYFSTSSRLKGTSQFLHPKIFRWDAINGLSLYEQRPSGIPFPYPQSYFGTSEKFRLDAPDVSADASVVALTGTSYCRISGCLGAEQYQSTIRRAGQPDIVVPGSAVLSRNGLYALLRTSISPFFAGVVPPQMNLLDIRTGQTTPTPESVPLGQGRKHALADDGTLALANLPAAFQQSLSSSAPLITTAYPLVNAAGNLVIYQAGGGKLGPARLSVYSAASGASVDLVSETAAAPAFLPSISDDGSLVAFVDGADQQAYVIGSNGSGRRQITSFSEPVTEIELSGDGTVAFVVTAANRLARINVASAQSVDIAPPAPYYAYSDGLPSWSFSRGSVAQLNGWSGLATDPLTALPPYPLSLGGVELHVGGIAEPIAGISPTSLSYPAPWDLANARVEVEVWAASAIDSPFVPGFLVDPASPGSTPSSSRPGPPS